MPENVMISRGDVTGRLPLSVQQEGVWFLERISEESAYMMRIVRSLRGPLDLSCLRGTLSDLVRRHPSLRTSFGEFDGVPFQSVEEPKEVAIEVVALGDVAVGREDEAIQREIRDNLARPFDLFDQPLFRPGLIKVGDDHHVLVLATHHLVGDGWSNRLLTQEFIRMYEARMEGRAADLPELPISYGDYAIWQRDRIAQGALEGSLTYWEELFSELPPPLALETDSPRPPFPSNQGHVVSQGLQSSVRDALIRVGLRERCLPFFATLAAYASLLHALTNQETIVVGFPSANRVPETKGIVGFFANTVAIPIHFAREATFREVLRQVRTTLLEIRPHREVPFRLVVGRAVTGRRDMSRNPLFQTMFAYDASDIVAVGQFAGLTMKPLVTGRSTSQFDLSFRFLDRQGAPVIQCEYATDIFTEASSRRMIEYFGDLCGRASDYPDEPIMKLAPWVAESRD